MSDDELVPFHLLSRQGKWKRAQLEDSAAIEDSSAAEDSILTETSRSVVHQSSEIISPGAAELQDSISVDDSFSAHMIAGISSTHRSTPVREFSESFFDNTFNDTFNSTIPQQSITTTLSEAEELIGGDSTVQDADERFDNYRIIYSDPPETGTAVPIPSVTALAHLLDLNEPEHDPYFGSSDEENEVEEPDEEISTTVAWDHSEINSSPPGGDSENEELTEEQKATATMTNFLRNWAFECNTPANALSKLAKGIKNTHPQCFSGLPVDARTIMKTPTKKLDLRPVAPGQYYHIGVRKQLDFIASLLKGMMITYILLLFNVDGVPLFKSGSSHLWPILMAIPSIMDMKFMVFPIGLYHGPSKPGSFQKFLDPFIQELHDLIGANDYFVNGQRIRIEVMGFCCDGPARADLLAVKHPSGYHSCIRCVTKGLHISGTRVFPEVNAALRTDIAFRRREDTDFQPAGRRSALLDLPQMNFTRSIILDSMHVVFLNVTRGLLRIWFHSVIPFKVTSNQRDCVNDTLADFKYFTPSEFARKVRSVEHAPRYKATEGRLFLLYLGPVVMKHILSRDKYIHFMELVIAMRILHSPKFCADKGSIKYADNLLKHFVENMSELYSVAFVTPNFHALIHLCEDVEYFCDSIENFSINDISAFMFENYMQVFKRLTRGFRDALPQLGRRFCELFSSDFWKRKYAVREESNEVIFLKKHRDGPLPYSCKDPQFGKAHFKNFRLCLNKPADCTFGTKKGEVVIVENFAFDRESNEKVAIGKKYTERWEFFGDPLISSKKLGIYKVSKLSKNLQVWPVKEIVRKYVRLPYKEHFFVVLPLLHSDLTPSQI